MLHIPILRQGKPYESVSKIEICHHATGEVVACVSQANSGMIRRDILGMADDVLEAFTVNELIAMCRKAAELFASAELPIGEVAQTFDDYVGHLSATTGMPTAYCRNNANKIYKVLAEIESVIGGLTRGFDLGILDRGYGSHGGGMLSFYRQGRIFGAVLPNNSPGVHSLWAPAVALKAPIVLKPGSQEPWTPLRLIEAFCAAGMPCEAFGFYPSDHAGAQELLRTVHRSMVFGDVSTTKQWIDDARVEVHGPGYSKVILGDDAADHWGDHVDVIESSILTNGGRSCINASGVWTPRNGRLLAENLAERLAKVEARSADDPDALIAAFPDPNIAERISTMIDQLLKVQGAIDLTEQVRGEPRFCQLGRCAYLLPTIIWCEDRDHPLANREFLFPFASVVECPSTEMASSIGPTLVASAITEEPRLIQDLMNSPQVDRLNIGAVETWRISWDQPHEGNLFEHLYRQRAFQIEPAA